MPEHRSVTEIALEHKEQAMARVSMIEREALPPDQRRFHDAVKAIRRNPISGPFIVLMNSSPDLCTRYAQLGHYFHARGQGDESILSMRVRTFIAMLGARALDGVYEWAAWVGWAREAGLPQETIDAIRERKPLTALTAEDQLVLDFCTQMISGNHRLNDSTFKAALAHFGTQGVVELVATLGYFAMIALPLNAFEIEMTARQLSLRKPFAPLTYDAHRDVSWLGPQAQARIASPAPSGAERVPHIRGHEDLPVASDQRFLDRVVRTRGRIAPPFQVLLHSADVADRLASIGSYLLFEGCLTPAARSIAGLIVASDLDSDYVAAACRAEARSAGVSQALIDALWQRRPLPGLTKQEAAEIDFCLQLVRGNHHVSEAAYRAAVECFGVPATVQIAAMLGYAVMISLLTNVFELAIDADDAGPAM
jgi:4-carboxymuconolactone decarboxylase